MNPLRFVLPFVLVLVWAIPAAADEPLPELLRHRLENPGKPGELVAGGQVLYAAGPLQALYLRRGWRPLWLGEDARASAPLDQVVDAIDLASEHGLDPEHYHRRRLAELPERLEETPRAKSVRRLQIDIELLASDALLTLADRLQRSSAS